ncbi:MAG: hypothetical protein Q8P02_01895, partial [Candidatus Micrarchaeota archaeon]|nr:hypothetical protein [Candidatus Micrarchaeota archaeon]
VFALLPVELTSELRITEVQLEDFNGNVFSLPNENLAVSSGDFYKVLLTVNLPSVANASHVYLRVGANADVATEKAVVVSFSQPPEAETTHGQRYNPPDSCTDDLGEQNGDSKWVDWKFTDFGAKQLMAVVFVKPGATDQDQLLLNYRVSAKAGDVVQRVPLDSVLGQSERTADLDACYAQTLPVRLPVVSGKSTCTENACITTLFATENRSASNGLRTDLQQQFNASISLRAFSPLDAPFLTIATDPTLQILGYDFGDGVTTASGQSLTLPLAVFNRLGGVLSFQSILPTQSAKVLFTFGDASGDILAAQRYVVVQGNGEFQLAAQPLELKAQQRNTLLVNVLSAQGVPVTNAKLALKETDGFAFNGFPSGPETVLGDGQDGTGKDGIYRFDALRPESVGRIAVVATASQFREKELELSVSADEPLEFDRDASGVELSCD